MRGWSYRFVRKISNRLKVILKQYVESTLEVPFKAAGAGKGTWTPTLLQETDFAYHYSFRYQNFMPNAQSLFVGLDFLFTIS